MVGDYVTVLGTPPEICHGNGGFCTFCFQGPPPASRSSSELTTSTGMWQAHTLSTSQGWGLEDRNVSTRQISDKDVLRLIEALWPQVQKKKKHNSRSSQHGNFQCSSSDWLPSKSKHSSPPGISLHCHPGIPLLSTQSWRSCFLHPTDICHS